jgi:rSAM/selenodomain-associated transferase 2
MYPSAKAFVPELSIVVPILNESSTLPSLFSTLKCQQGVLFELILCDGGSDDSSRQVLEGLVGSFPFSCTLLTSEPGRARQLNIGAAHSRADMILFLHVDSSFDSPHALAKGVASLKSAYRQCGHHKIAGHFPLHFIRHSSKRSWVFYHYAWKTYMHRSYCIHGDQGFLLSREFFAVVGPFDESLPFLEDIRLAKRIANCGQWMLLPEVIGTSARRFEYEGFYQRQVLNALVLACEDADSGAWLDTLPGLYREQSACNRLFLGPFFREIAGKIALMEWKDQLRFWRKIGSFVCGNAWQLALMADTRRHFRNGVVVGQGRLTCTGWFDRFAAPIIQRPFGIWTAAILTWIWFRWRIFISCWF